MRTHLAEQELQSNSNSIPITRKKDPTTDFWTEKHVKNLTANLPGQAGEGSCSELQKATR